MVINLLRNSLSIFRNIPSHLRLHDNRPTNHTSDLVFDLSPCKLSYIHLLENVTIMKDGTGGAILERRTMPEKVHV